MIEIRPDPKHPRGGFAEITIAGATAEADPVEVAVFNSYQQKWLGPEGWQANRATIPAREAAADGDGLRLIVGPEIVNRIEEDTPIRVEIGSDSWDTYWPDDINAGPDEAIIGGIGGTGTTPGAKAPTVMVAQPDPVAPPKSELSATESEQDPEEETDADLDDDDEIETAEDKKSPMAMIAGIALLALLVAGGAYFMLGREDAPEETAVVATAPVPEPTTGADSCAVDQVAALSGQGFGAVADKMRECGNALSPDSALGLVEQAANSGDAEALNLFGSLYDSRVTDDVIEGQIGLSFPDQAPRAAEYYGRAIAAGSTEAEPRLLAVCNRLRLETDTLSQSAYEDYCQ